MLDWNLTSDIAYGIITIDVKERFAGVFSVEIVTINFANSSTFLWN